MKKSIYQSIATTIVFFVIFGGIYPFLTTIIGNFIFKSQATGSIIIKNNEPIGSKLIGQNFTKDIYFHGRPSSAGKGYDASNSSASNLAQTNKALFEKIEKSIEQILKENPTLKREDIPVDLVTSSGSGLDPEISVDSALVQIPRVAKARKLDENRVKSVVEKNSHTPIFGFIGESTVNVLELNLDLDSLK